jgi:hypothetical protein
MERTWQISGVFGNWRMTVELLPAGEDEPGIPLDEVSARRALARFKSLDPHFFDVVNLTESLELSER